MSSETIQKYDYRQDVTDSIIQMLEEGTAPWQKPWQPGALEMPFNPTSNKPYRGGNAVHLMAIGVARGYDDPRWMTYRQAQQNGWQVRGGEKGSPIEYWEFPPVPEIADGKVSEPLAEDSPAPQNKQFRRMIHRVYTVFNARQIDGVPERKSKQREAFEIVSAGESILQHSGARIRHDQNDRAFYNRYTDFIYLPPKSAFHNAANYYGTALHELGHWTGHSSRLNRDTLNSSKHVGDENYAREELRAELASVFLAAERGIPHDPANHAAYVASWIKALQEDKNEIFRAAKDAHRATDFLLALEMEKSVEAALDTEDPRHQRANSQDGAEFEPDSGPVSVEPTSTARDEGVFIDRKGNSADSLAQARRPTENVLGSDIRPDADDFKHSFLQAKEVTKQTMGDKARTFVASTDSGIYAGEIIGETDLHVVQRLNDRSAVAHMKHLLQTMPDTGSQVLISYSQQTARVQTMPSRTREHERSR